MERKTNYIYLAISLFVLYVLQEIAQVKFAPLENLQANETYRRWSGLVVFLFVTWQWALSVVRIKWAHKPARVEKFYTIHAWIGSFAPLLFYLHSTKPGFAYLLVLTLSFYANFCLGLINLDVLKKRAYWYFQSWMIAHVSLSIIITGLSIYHVWIVFYYN